MSIEFRTLDPELQTYGSYVAFKCGNEHSLFIEQPPALATRQFFSWAQKGVVEIFGGQTVRPIAVEVWIHDSTFTTLALLDAALIALDAKAGEFGDVRITTPETITRTDVRFVGFHRVPFEGQKQPAPILAQGVSNVSYGNWHIAGELHFLQLMQ